MENSERVTNYDVCPKCGARTVEPSGWGHTLLHCSKCDWEIPITITERNSGTPNIEEIRQRMVELDAILDDHQGTPEHIRELREITHVLLDDRKYETLEACKKCGHATHPPMSCEGRGYDMGLHAVVACGCGWNVVTAPADTRTLTEEPSQEEGRGAEPQADQVAALDAIISDLCDAWRGDIRAHQDGCPAMFSNCVPDDCACGLTDKRNEEMDYIKQSYASAPAAGDDTEAAFHRGVDAAKEAIRQTGTENWEGSQFKPYFISAIARKCGTDRPSLPSQEGGRESKAHATGMVAAFQTAYEEGYKAGLAATPTEEYRRGLLRAAEIAAERAAVYAKEYAKATEFDAWDAWLARQQAAESVERLIREEAEGEKA